MISYLEELKKSRRNNKALKKQLTKIEKLANGIKIIQEALEIQMNEKEKEFEKKWTVQKIKITELKKNKLVLEEYMKESKEKNELLIK